MKRGIGGLGGGAHRLGVAVAVLDHDGGQWKSRWIRRRVRVVSGVAAQQRILAIKLSLANLVSFSEAAESRVLSHPASSSNQWQTNEQ
jgi:hypothetical protein